MFNLVIPLQRWLQMQVRLKNEMAWLTYIGTRLDTEESGSLREVFLDSNWYSGNRWTVCLPGIGWLPRAALSRVSIPANSSYVAQRPAQRTSLISSPNIMMLITRRARPAGLTKRFRKPLKPG